MKTYTLFEAKCEILRQTGVKPKKAELARVATDDNPDVIDALTLARIVERHNKNQNCTQLVELMWKHVLSQGGTCDLKRFKEFVHVPNATEVFSAIDVDRRGFIGKEDLLAFLRQDSL